MNERSTFAEPALLGNLTQDVLLPPSLQQRVTLEPGSQRVSQTADPSPACSQSFQSSSSSSKQPVSFPSVLPHRHPARTPGLAVTGAYLSVYVAKTPAVPSAGGARSYLGRL